MFDISLTVLMVFAYSIAIVFLLSGTDDLIIDCIYWIWARKKKNMLKLEDILKEKEKPIAVVIAAWKEEDVIDKMVVNAIKMIDYKDYDIFVGIYPNDEGTKKSLLSLEEHYFDKVHIIVNDLEGPTNKGQNLNMVFKGIQDFEALNGKRYEILIMQDSEDIIHPLSLKLFNHLMPQKAMVQIPVFPIEPQMNLKNFFRYIISSTYADEFAENHTKDIIVRKQMKGIIPSAGVGTAFARDALEKIAAKNQGNVFNYNNVTEDYEVAIRFHEEGLETDYYAEGVLRLDDQGKRRKEYIATREFFPNTFRAAVKQKSRWVYGITFQTPSQHSIKGKTFPQKYSLLRDRKARYVNMVNLPAYLLFFFSIFDLVYSFVTGQPSTFTSKIFPIFSLMWFVVLADTIMALFRAVNRYIAIQEIYGKKHAFFAVMFPPIISFRLICGNVINFFSTLDAWKTFLFGNRKKVKWNKTVHKEYAPEEVLNEYKRKLGDILLENKMVSEADLSKALQEHTKSGALLGKYLVENRIIKQKDMETARAIQIKSYPNEIRFEDLDTSLVYMIPEALSVIGQVLAIGRSQGALLVAKAPGSPETFTEIIQEKTGYPVEYLEIEKSKLKSLIETAYSMAEIGQIEESRFGNLLVREEVISEEMLEVALHFQKKTHFKIGKTLLYLQYVNEETLAKYLAKYFGLPYKTLDLQEVDKETAMRFPKQLSIRHGILPFGQQAGKVLLALSDPLAQEAIGLVKKAYDLEIKPFVCTHANILSVVSKIHAKALRDQDMVLERS